MWRGCSVSQATAWDRQPWGTCWMLEQSWILKRGISTPMTQLQCSRPTWESCQNLCSHTDTIMLTWRLEVVTDINTHPSHPQIIKCKLFSTLSLLLFIVDMVCPGLTLFDEKGDKTETPDKDRQIEAFQLLFMLLPAANRSLLKLLLDLLHHTARNQHVNKMSAINLATMFAPHIIWPKNVRSTDAPLFLLYKFNFKVWFVLFFRWLQVTYRKTLKNWIKEWPFSSGIHLDSSR